MTTFFKHVIIVSLLTMLTTAASSAQSAQTYERDSAILAFRPGSSVLFEYYRQNQSELNSIMTFAARHASTLRAGLSHLNIVAYITEYEIGNPVAINRASLQASVVRAQFKAKYNIPHGAITFAIDTARNINNIVQVDYINTPVPLYSNSSIYYTESSSTATMRQQMDKYTPSIPYTNYYMYLSKTNPNFTMGKLTALQPEALENVAEYDLNEGSTIITEAEKPTTTTPPAQAPTTTPSETNAPVLATPPGANDNLNTNYTNRTITAKPQLAEVFGLKTNLLYWAMAIPNIEMEFYMGGRVSLNVEGAYTWAWFFPVDKAYHIWNAGGELRFWLKDQKQFYGHFFGIYGNTGQYDFKFGHEGKQGDFSGMGITYGYTLPIKKRFNIEFSIGAGWETYSLTKYKYENNHNSPVELSSGNNYFGITKAKVALLWKF